MQPSPPPAFPTPSPPEGGYGCPRCHSPHTSAYEGLGNSAARSALGQAQCNSCGYVFDEKSGKSAMPRIALMIALPVLVALVTFGWLFMSCIR